MQKEYAFLFQNLETVEQLYDRLYSPTKGCPFNQDTMVLPVYVCVCLIPMCVCVGGGGG